MFKNTKIILNLFQNNRVIFQSLDKAPKSSESIKGPEKQTEAQALSEVASQSPSEIYSDTVSAGSTIKQQYTQNTTILANIINNDPLFGSSSNAGTTSDNSNTANSQNLPTENSN